MLDEYDFSSGAGQVCGPFCEGGNMVVLDPDVAKVFPDSESVNQALRSLAVIIQNQASKT